jgi:hypothetical protein
VVDSSGYVSTATQYMLQQLHKDDLITTSVGELLVLLSERRCNSCDGKLNFTKINGSAAITVHQQCVKCKAKCRWSSFPKFISDHYKGTYVDCARAVVGAILAGATYHIFSEGNDLAGIKHLTEDRWQKWEKNVGEVVEKMVQASELRARKACYENKGFNVAIDCWWSSRGYNAEEGTVTCCDVVSGSVIYHSHLLCAHNAPAGMFLIIYLFIIIYISK